MAHRGVEITLRLLTKGFSKGARNAKRELKGIRGAAKMAGGRVAELGGKALDRIGQVGMAAAGVGLAKAMKDLTELESRMTRVALTARQDVSEVDALNQKLLELSGMRTGQITADLLTGVEELIALDVPWDEVLGTRLLEDLGRTATATGADMGDLARMAYTLRNAYGLTAEEVGRAMEQMAFAGKRGGFLFDAQAAALPEIAASMAMLGQTGDKGLVRTAAMMQIVRREAGSSAEAATNLTNALQYLASPDFNRRAAKEGFDVFDEQGRMRDLFLILDDIVRVTEKGANTDAMGRMFGDKQARLGMLALSRNYEDLKGLIDEVQGSTGVIDADFAAISETTAQQIKNLRAELERLANVTLAPQVEQLGQMVEHLNENPQKLQDLLKVAGALIGVGVMRKPAAGAWKFGKGLSKAWKAGRVAAPAAGGARQLSLFGGQKVAGRAAMFGGSKLATRLAMMGGTSVAASGPGEIAAAILAGGVGGTVSGGLNQMGIQSLTGGAYNPRDFWEHGAAILADWMGAEWAKYYRQDQARAREQFKDEMIRIEVEITDEREKRKAKREARRVRRGWNSRFGFGFGGSG